MLRSVLADFILVLHFAFVLGVVIPIPLIILGKALDWRWVRNRKFRLVHLAMICFVALEAVVGVICPLTHWEERLRGELGPQYDGSFVAYWLRQALYYDFEPWAFTLTYLAVAAIVLALYRWVPPRG